MFCREKKALLQGSQARRQEAILRFVSPSAVEWDFYVGRERWAGK